MWANIELGWVQRFPQFSPDTDPWHTHHHSINQLGALWGQTEKCPIRILGWWGTKAETGVRIKVKNCRKSGARGSLDTQKTPTWEGLTVWYLQYRHDNNWQSQGRAKLCSTSPYQTSGQNSHPTSSILKSNKYCFHKFTMASVLST